MRTSPISLLAALIGVIALLFYLAAVPLQQKAPAAAAPFCKTTEEHERQHGAKHAHRAHEAHQAHSHARAHRHQDHVHVPPAVNVPALRPPIASISPAATLKLDAFDAPSPLSVAEAEKASRATHR